VAREVGEVVGPVRLVGTNIVSEVGIIKLVEELEETGVFCDDDWESVLEKLVTGSDAEVVIRLVVTEVITVTDKTLEVKEGSLLGDVVTVEPLDVCESAEVLIPVNEVPTLLSPVDDEIPLLLLLLLLSFVDDENSVLRLLLLLSPVDGDSSVLLLLTPTLDEDWPDD
jgi:hypothetical protein